MHIICRAGANRLTTAMVHCIAVRRMQCTSSHDSLTTARPAATAYVYLSVRTALPATTTTSAGKQSSPSSTPCVVKHRRRLRLHQALCQV